MGIQYIIVSMRPYYVGANLHFAQFMQVGNYTLFYHIEHGSAHSSGCVVNDSNAQYGMATAQKNNSKNSHN